MTTEAVIDKRIPDKWRDYEPCGVPIRGERIIAFKTPLSRSYDNHSDLDNGIKSFERFTPLDLLRHLGNTGVTLGMVVDFTNTRRYYNSMEFSSKGIKYVKMNCVGKEIPNERIVQRFKEEVCRFFANGSTGALVGVHCTHGLNRAGYVVCRYLIECRGYSPERAIEAFSRARGYPMERENYLEDLRIRKPQFENTLAVGRAPRRNNRASPPQRPRHYHSETHPSQDRFWPQERSSIAPSHYRERHERFGFDARYTFQEHRVYPIETDYNAARNYHPRRQEIRERGRRNSYNNYSNFDNNFSDRRYDDQRPVRSFTHDNIRRPPSFRDRPAPYSRRSRTR